MKIVLDLDNTILDTPYTIVELWNKLNPNRKLKYVEDIEWDFSNILKGTDVTLKELFTLFDDEGFYDNAVVFDDAIDVINEISQRHEIIICSKHDEIRKDITTKWINKTFPNVKIMFVDNFENKKDLECDLIIDDKIESLGGKAKLSVCFGDYKWNKEWQKVRATKWCQIKSIIEFLESGDR